MKRVEYTLKPDTAGMTPRDVTMAEGPGVERWIIDPPLTPEQCERVAHMLGVTYAMGYEQARFDIRLALGAKPL